MDAPLISSFPTRHQSALIMPLMHVRWHIGCWVEGSQFVSGKHDESNHESETSSPGNTMLSVVVGCVVLETTEWLLVCRHLSIRRQCHEGLMLVTDLLRMTPLITNTEREVFW